MISLNLQTMKLIYLGNYQGYQQVGLCVYLVTLFMSVCVR